MSKSDKYKAFACSVNPVVQSTPPWVFLLHHGIVTERNMILVMEMVTLYHY
jgi:hypothetical protein